MSKIKTNMIEESHDDGTLNGRRPVSADDISSSCKFRAYVNEQQFSTIGHYLYWVDDVAR